MFKRVSYFLFLVGLTIFMYPHVMKIFFEVQSDIEITEYDNTLEDMTDEEISDYIEEMEDYNDYIANNPLVRIPDPFTPITSRSEIAASSGETGGEVGGMSGSGVKPRSVSASGPFAYIDIPRIGQKLPIYLGATDANLAKGVAQLERTSLPIGGLGTHSVIAGHRGFNRSVPFFKYLNQMVIGDRFYIHVLGRTLTYEVFAIEIILPDEREKLSIDPTKDLVTLLTCEPYKVNTHRLLIFAARVNGEGSLGNSDEEKNIVSYSGVLSVNYSRELAVSSEVRFDKIISYIIVVVGSVLWIVTFILLLRTFRRKPKV